MKQFALTLNTISPLAIRLDHAPTGTDTAKYISGTTLAGGLAALHRLLHRGKTDEFTSLFLDEKVQYPNLYPAQFKDEGMQNAQTLTVYPLPKTAQSCKRFSGFVYRFKSDEDDTERHGVRDTLVDWIVFSMGSRSNVPGDGLLALLDHYKECQTCGASMDHFSGYYRRDDLEPAKIISPHVEEHTRLQTRTGINRETGTVQEEILYNREVFEEGMHFWGLIKLADEVADSFSAFIESTTDNQELMRIGTGRTRGMGKVSLDLRVVRSRQSFSSFKERLLAFHEILSSQARETGLTNLRPFYFAMTLHSPLIVHDSQLRYRGTFDEEALGEVLHMSASMFTCEFRVADVQRIMGWNELWGTPRQQAYAIEMGSVFVFSYMQEPDDAFLQALFDLEEQGIGQRLPEGFGRVRLSDPFHIERGLL